MNTHSKTRWPAALHAFWWAAFTILVVTVVSLIGFAIVAFEKGRFDWRGVAAAVAPAAMIVWLIDAKRHPEKWLDAQGKSRFTW